MEYEDKIRLLSENAMLADDGMFSPEMLAGWQNRMRIAAAWCDRFVPAAPAFGVTVSPDALRQDCPNRGACIGIDNSLLRVPARADMAEGDYIRVPKVVGE